MKDKLIQGFERFHNGYFQRNREYLAQLAKKQSPQIAIVSCCDSRVDPNILFDLDPGDLFVIRNVANLVPPFETQGDYHGTSAALEFAVSCLRVKQVVVLGHAHCGGIRALMENDGSMKPDGFIDSWMQLAQGAKEEVLARTDLATAEMRMDACEKTAVKYSLKNLMTYPWVQREVAEGNLSLMGFYYDLRSGEMVALDEIDGATT